MNYPIVKLSTEYVEVFERFQFKIPKKPVQPFQPKKPEERDVDDSFMWGVFLWFGGPFLLLGLYLASEGKSKQEGMMILCFAITAFVFMVTLWLAPSKEKQKNEFHQNMIDFEKKMIKYQSDKIKYDNDLKIWKDECEALNNPVEILRRKKAKFKGLQAPSEVISGDKNPNKGVTEQIAHTRIVNIDRFEVVRNNDMVDIGNYYLCPDFIVALRSNTTKFIIEIDEPYIGPTGEPIHYKGGKDSKRDNKLRNKGYHIVRFTEKQFYSEFAKCMKYFIEIHNSVQRRESITEINEIKFEGEVVPMWTKDEAHKLAFQRYRQTYLSEDMIENMKDSFI